MAQQGQQRPRRALHRKGALGLGVVLTETFGWSKGFGRSVLSCFHGETTGRSDNLWGNHGNIFLNLMENSNIQLSRFDVWVWKMSFQWIYGQDVRPFGSPKAPVMFDPNTRCLQMGLAQNGQCQLGIVRVDVVLNDGISETSNFETTQHPCHPQQSLHPNIKPSPRKRML